MARAARVTSRQWRSTKASQATSSPSAQPRASARSSRCRRLEVASTSDGDGGAPREAAGGDAGQRLVEAVDGQAPARRAGAGVQPLRGLGVEPRPADRRLARRGRVGRRHASKDSRWRSGGAAPRVTRDGVSSGARNRSRTRRASAAASADARSGARHAAGERGQLGARGPRQLRGGRRRQRGDQRRGERGVRRGERGDERGAGLTARTARVALQAIERGERRLHRRPGRGRFVRREPAEVEQRLRQPLHRAIDVRRQRRAAAGTRRGTALAHGTRSLAPAGSRVARRAPAIPTPTARRHAAKASSTSASQNSTRTGRRDRPRRLGPIARQRPIDALLHDRERDAGRMPARRPPGTPGRRCAPGARRSRGTGRPRSRGSTRRPASDGVVTPTPPRPRRAGPRRCASAPAARRSRRRRP